MNVWIQQKQSLVIEKLTQLTRAHRLYQSVACAQLYFHLTDQGYIFRGIPIVWRYGLLVVTRIRLNVLLRTWDPLHQRVPITIQIPWEFYLAVIQLLVIISQHNYAHATTAQLSCYVQNFVEITSFKIGWEQNEISITFELWRKKC